MEYRVNVYENEWKEEIIGRVRYNANLDYWDGRNWTCGAMACHLGLTKLKDGRYVLIHGTDYVDSKDWAEVVSKEDALQAVLKSGNVELLETKKFAELKKMYDELAQDDEDLD